MASLISRWTSPLAHPATPLIDHHPSPTHGSPPFQQGSRVLRLSWQPQPERAAIAARRRLGNAPLLEMGGRRLPELEQFGDERCGTCGAVTFDWPVVDLAPDLLGDHLGDGVGCCLVEVQHPAGAVLVEPVTDMEVLLEVVTQRNVKERPPGCGQFHAGGQPALHHCQIAGGEMSIQLRDKPAHLEALMLWERVRDLSVGP